jgi:hypothetical protein
MTTLDRLNELVDQLAELERLGVVDAVMSPFVPDEKGPTLSGTRVVPESTLSHPTVTSFVEEQVDHSTSNLGDLEKDLAAAVVNADRDAFAHRKRMLEDKFAIIAGRKAQAFIDGSGEVTDETAAATFLRMYDAVKEKLPDLFNDVLKLFETTSNRLDEIAMSVSDLHAKVEAWHGDIASGNVHDLEISESLKETAALSGVVVIAEVEQPASGTVEKITFNFAPIKTTIPGEFLSPRAASPGPAVPVPAAAGRGSRGSRPSSPRNVSYGMSAVNDVVSVVPSSPRSLGGGAGVARMASPRGSRGSQRTPSPRGSRGSLAASPRAPSPRGSRGSQRTPSPRGSRGSLAALPRVASPRGSRAPSPAARAPSPRRSPSPVRRAPSPRRSPSPVRRAPSPASRGGSMRAPSPPARAAAPRGAGSAPLRRPTGGFNLSSPGRK